jgi:type IV secretion system protein VirB1
MIEENRMKLGILGWLCLLFALPTSAQQHSQTPRLTAAEFTSLAGRCAPNVPADTLLAIARTESGLNANAISINRPRASAKRAGYANGQIMLSRQPRNRIEAGRWLHWLELHHFTVSIGLMQVNIESARSLRVSADQLFEPCTNLRLGARILTAAYSEVSREIGEGFAALDAALSMYNTGDSTAGFRNGYVANVHSHVPRDFPFF